MSGTSIPFFLYSTGETKFTAGYGSFFAFWMGGVGRSTATAGRFDWLITFGRHRRRR